MKKTSKKKPLEFSQKWLLGSAVFTVFFVGLSYLFSVLGIDTLENLSITIVQVGIGGTAVQFLGYNAQNIGRAYSADKYGVNTSSAESESEEDSNEDEVKLCGK